MSLIRINKLRERTAGSGVTIEDMRATGPMFDVRADTYGATGNGTTDDTSAIQAAIDAAETAGGGTVLLSPGTYRITSALTIRADEVWIAGIKGGSVLSLDTNSDSVAAIDIGLASAGDGNDYRYRCGIRDLEITHHTEGGHGIGIYLHDCFDTVVSGVYVHDLYDGLRTSDWLHTLRIDGRSRFDSNANRGIAIVGNATQRKTFFVQLNSVRSENNGSHGLYFYCGTDLYLDAQCLMGNNGVRNGTRIGDANGIHIEGTTTVRCQTWNLAHSDADANTGYNIYVKTAEWGSISHYWTGGAGGQGRPRSVIAEGSIVVKAGIYFEDVRTSDIDDCLVYWNSVNGIQLKDCYDVEVSGTRCIGNGTDSGGVSLDGCGVLVEGPNYSFVTLRGVRCTGADTDRNQSYGIRIAANCPNEVLVDHCSAFNNATRDFDNLNTTDAVVRVLGSRFGTSQNLRTISTRYHAYEFEDSFTGTHRLKWTSGVPGTGDGFGAGDLALELDPDPGKGWAYFNDAGDWVPVYRPAVSADRGDADVTLGETDAPTQRFNAVLTTDRAVALPTTGLFNGWKFRIVRTAAATGAFNLNVGTGPLKALAAGQWCEVEYNGSAWMLTAAGSL